MTVTIPDDANEQFADLIRRYTGGARLAQTDLPEKLAEKVQSWLAASVEADHARQRAMAGGMVTVSPEADAARHRAMAGGTATVEPSKPAQPALRDKRGTRWEPYPWDGDFPLWRMRTWGRTHTREEIDWLNGPLVEEGADGAEQHVALRDRAVKALEAAGFVDDDYACWASGGNRGDVLTFDKDEQSTYWRTKAAGRMIEVLAAAGLGVAIDGNTLNMAERLGNGEIVELYELPRDGDPSATDAGNLR